MALCKRIAATVESTPPDNPKTTLSFLSLDFRSATVSSTNESGVQSWFKLEIETKKFFNISFPSIEWYTSG